MTSRHASTGSSGSAADPLVTWAVDENTKVGTIELCSPDTYNALTIEMGYEFQALVSKIKTDINSFDQGEDGSTGNNVNAIVLRGQGGKAFSAGGNLEWLHSLRQNSVHANAAAMMEFYQNFLSIRSLPVPVLADLTGPAMGAGACLALACDLRVVPPLRDNDEKQSLRPILGFPFTTLGISPGLGGSHLLPKVLGSQTKANEILLLAKSLTASDCVDLGLAIQGDTNDIASRIARQHPTGTRATVQMTRLDIDEGLPAALQREAMSQAVCYARGDWGVGVTAVANKERPEFDDYWKP